MIESVRKTIDGQEYVIHQLGARAGRAMLVRLTKMLGPAMGHLATIDASEMTAALTKSLVELSACVSVDDFEEVCRIFGERTEVSISGRLLQLDLDQQDLLFAGRYDRMFLWLRACIEVNYAPFLAMFTLAKKKGDRAESRKSDPDSQSHQASQIA